MRALLVLVLLTSVARGERAGFDHTLHDGQATMRGGEAPACTACHALGPRSRPIVPGHAACSGTACHELPRKPAMSDARLCQACHAPGQKKASWNSSPGSRDFNLRIGHDRHAAPSRAAAGKGCLTCHVAPGARAAPPASHARCNVCHATPALPMTACDTCHEAVVGRAHAPEQVDSPYSVRGRFAHEKHLARMVGAGDPCLPCHAVVEMAIGDQVPAPSMRGCESCHDGKQAFSALLTCRSCHQSGQALPSSEPPRRFEHRQHRELGVPLDCATCHQLRPDGQPAVIGHAACIDAACHADDFRARQARTCGGCHVGTEPWRPLGADVGRRPDSELGVEFSHAGHQVSRCESCHDAGARVPMRLSAGHVTCAGAACHPSVAPAFDACDACHRLGLLPERDQRRRTATWAVARRFSHAVHAARGSLECAVCHTSAAGATRVADIVPPAKASCAPCHDGKSAFKMTGHGCNRCHDQDLRTP